VRFHQHSWSQLVLRLARKVEVLIADSAVLDLVQWELKVFGPHTEESARSMLRTLQEREQSPLGVS